MPDGWAGVPADLMTLSDAPRGPGLSPQDCFVKAAVEGVPLLPSLFPSLEPVPGWSEGHPVVLSCYGPSVPLVPDPWQRLLARSLEGPWLSPKLTNRGLANVANHTLAGCEVRFLLEWEVTHPTTVMWRIWASLDTHILTALPSCGALGLQPLVFVSGVEGRREELWVTSPLEEVAKLHIPATVVIGPIS